ncbi:MAG: DUF72 domain-containing protein [Candidatus Tritonobacter lacicola]|nr:DUF72 domain-containing protein [Candidatus Tritonobacter lacicola]
MTGMLFVGTSGWSYGHWKGLFYPDDLPRSKWFAHYVKTFSAVEINYSFYRMPSPSTIEKWGKETPGDFVFAMKASRYLTHMKRLNVEGKSVDVFAERVGGLGKKLGPVLYQLPPKQEKDLRKLENFIGLLPGGMRHAVEFRHDSWICEETFSLLEKHGVCYCIVSAPRLKCERRVTAPFAYIRMHGAKSWYRSKYSDGELGDWADFICRALKDGLDIYIFFNNDHRAFAAQNALTLRAMIEKMMEELA